MDTKIIKSKKYLRLSLSILIVLIYLLSKACFAASPVKVILDGKEFTSDPEPFIENGRTLIPIRFISEELGAEVNWNNEDRIATIKKDNTTVHLKIDSHLVTYEKGNKTYSLTDVAPKIIDNRTFVPLRLVSNALGVGIDWNQLTRTVYIDSNKESDIVPFFDVKIATVTSGQTISGRTKLQTKIAEKYINDGNYIKYLLLEPDTLQGFVIAQGNNLTDEYVWIPDLRESGNRILVSAIYDKHGKFVAGDAVGVYVDVNPTVQLNGVQEGEILKDTVYLGVDTNFVSTRVEYEIKNLDTGVVSIIGRDTPQDPYGKYKWDPNEKDNGNYLFKAIAYDTNGNAYTSQQVYVNIDVEPKLSLSGIQDGQTIDKPVTLIASRNFDVKNTRYILINPYTGEESILEEIPYGSYVWFPSPELKGTKEVVVEVEDTLGIIHRSEPIKVNVKDVPILLLDGIGPNQVLTEPTSLSIRSNVTLQNVNYVITNRGNGKVKTLASNEGPLFKQTFIPGKEDEGYWYIKAVSYYNGEKVESEEVPFRVYLGETYKAVSIVSTTDYVNEFLKLASKLALKSWNDTGMSASLQAAQSILETGWGKSVPVDKYSGKLSYNLFGIKGEGPSGSVVYNTWEVYNGKTYRVDAKFRAYNSVEESWADHKNLLLNSARYEPFKEVMHDYVQGAWALKRSGYATDPEYATKLIRIINQYNLRELDRVGI